MVDGALGLAFGDQPRRTIGTVNAAEFIVTLAISITFLTQLDLSRYWNVMLGLVVGGAMAAPLAGYLVKILPMRVMLLLVGAVVTALTALNLVGHFA